VADVEEFRARRNCCNGLFFPLVLILVGTIFLLTQLNLIEPWRAWDFFWPFILVFFGVRLLATQRAWLGIVAIAFGVALAGRPLGFWYLDLDRFWPVLLIVLGVAMLLRPGWVGSRRGRLRAWPQPGPANAGESIVDGLGVLGGFQRRVTSQAFTGGSLTAFFGGFNLDLTRAGIAGDSAVIDITAVFGGGEIRVPETWVVDVQGQGIFGAFNDESHQQAPQAGAKRLILRGVALFGGVVIKN